MNLLSQLLALSILLLLMAQAIGFQRATVCRSRAWGTSLVLLTRNLLSEAKNKEASLIATCGIFVQRNGRKLSWRKVADLKARRFDVSLKGKL